MRQCKKLTQHYALLEQYGVQLEVFGSNAPGYVYSNRRIYAST